MPILYENKQSKRVEKPGLGEKNPQQIYFFMVQCLGLRWYKKWTAFVSKKLNCLMFWRSRQVPYLKSCWFRWLGAIIHTNEFVIICIFVNFLIIAAQNAFLAWNDTETVATSIIQIEAWYLEGANNLIKSSSIPILSQIRPKLGKWEYSKVYYTSARSVQFCIIKFHDRFWEFSSHFFHNW